MPNPIDDAIDALSTKVEALTNAEQSAVALIQGISAQLRANANSPAKILALADKIDADTTELAAAVVAGTT